MGSLLPDKVGHPVCASLTLPAGKPPPVRRDERWACPISGLPMTRTNRLPATSISRWTPAYFAAALLSLLLGEAMLAAGFGLPFDSGSGESLAVLHLIVLGWLSLLMAGALLQFVPVLVGRPLFAPGLALPALVMLMLGLVLLFLSFLDMSGLVDLSGGLFAAAAGFLSGAVLLLAVMIGGTIAMARPLVPAVLFVALGLLALAVAAGLGSLFAGTLSGLVSSSAAVDLLLQAPPVHAFAGLFGWLTLTAVGVSYRLLPMFLLSPSRISWPQRVTLCLGGLSLASAVATVPLIAAGLPARAAILAAAIMGLGALASYLVSVLHFYRARKRRVLDLSAKTALAAYGALGFSCLLFAQGIFVNAAQPFMAAALFLFIFGWLSGLGLAKLYKIIAFLTWLERFGALLGRQTTPRVQDLVRDDHGGPWFVLYFAAIAAGTIALACNEDVGFRLSCGLLLVATTGLCREFRRIRRLTYVNAEIRLPVGATGPHPCLSTGS